MTKYAYYPNGFTASIVTPSGATTHFDYDARGNLARRVEYKTEVVNPAAGDISMMPVPYSPPAGYVRDTRWTYDEFNLEKTATLPAMSNSVDGATYSYADQTNQSAVTSKYSVTASGELVEAPASRTTSVKVGTTEKYRTTQNLDNRGRLTQIQKVGAGQTQTSTLTYHTGQNATLSLPDANGNVGTATQTAKQYGDLVAGVRIFGGTQDDFRYTYDALGNRVREVAYNTFRSNASISGGTLSETTSGSETRSSYNAFGQPVWSATSPTTAYDGSDFTPIQKKLVTYYGSGELDNVWEGTSQNVTDYRYSANTADVNFGRLMNVVTGVGSGGAVTTVHGQTDYAYDALGRMNKVTRDGFATTSIFDTLDRPVKLTLPDGSARFTRYHTSGAPEETTLLELDGRKIGTLYTLDGLGRVLTAAPKLDGAADSSRGTVTYTYDPYDRPIKVLDDSLVMNNAGDDRASFFKYDEFGNVTKALGPALRTAAAPSYAPAYTDARRPYVEYTYDDLLRPTAQTTLLNGSVTPASLALPSGATTSVTGYAYDAYDRLTQVTDPAGYTTQMTYDKLGHVQNSTQQVWKGTEADYGSLNNGFSTVTAYAAYDALGRPVKQIDGRGNARSVKYDLLGNVVSLTDARGIVTQGYTYTPDGLLEGVYEPDMNLNTSAATFDPASPTGFTKTRHFTYGTRAYPSEERRANMNTAAGAASGVKYASTYDFAGRPTLQTLPDGSTVSQTFDGRGNLTARTTPEGFKTTFAYDPAGRMTQRKAWARATGTGATTDNAAGLANGLTMDLKYDPAGNVITRIENGLYSDWTYSSNGQPLSTNRPHLYAQQDKVKYFTYRLDGARTAETTYGYAGDLTSKVNTLNTSTAFPTVTGGNVIVFDRDARGLIAAEKSAGMWNGTANNWAYTSTSSYDGLGRRAKRVFTGTGAIYPNMRNQSGVDMASPNHQSFWKFDQNGNLTEKYDTLPGSTDKQNSFSYTYSPTNRETAHTRDVQVRRQSTDTTNRLWNMGGGSGILLAGTQGGASTTYNERDLPENMSVTDATPAKGYSSGSEFSSFGPSVTKTSVLGYFLDGHRYLTTTNGSVTKRVDALDSRGRETNVYDPTSAYGAANVMSTYGADGMVTREVRRSDATTAFKEIMKPTLGGRRYSTYNSRDGETTTTFSQTGSALVGLPYVVTGLKAVSYGYDAYGNATSSVRGGVTTTSTYDVNNGLTGVSDGTTSVSYKLDGQGRRLSTTGGDYDGYATRYTAEGRVAGLSNEISNATSGIKMGRFDDFRYDPFGRQVLSSISGINELSGNGGYQVRRDNTSTVGILGMPNLITRTNDTSDDVPGQSPFSFRTSAFKDLGYSFADGATDTFGYNGITSFSRPDGVGTLSAPVKALSDQLKINPLDVKPASAPGLPVDPGEIKPGGSTEPQGVKSGLQPLGVGTLAVQPLQAPQSALPASLNTLNPLDVKGPGSSLPNVPGAETVKRPQGGTVTTQSIIVNPVEPSPEVPSDVYGASNTDGAYQENATGNYGYEDQYNGSATTDTMASSTASGGDMGMYNAAAENNSYESSALDPRVVGAIRQHDPSYDPIDYRAERARGREYDSGALNAAIQENLSNVESGRAATNVVGSFHDSDTTDSEANSAAIARRNGEPYELNHVETTREIPEQEATGGWDGSNINPKFQGVPMLASSDRHAAIPAAYANPAGMKVGEAIEGAFNYVGSAVKEGLGYNYFAAAVTGRSPDGEQLSNFDQFSNLLTGVIIVGSLGRGIRQGTNITPRITRWGYTGTSGYNNAVRAIRSNSGTLESVNGIRPSRQEAENLIAQAGGKVLRVERGHSDPNPHNYPHINYSIDGKNVLTIRVEGVGRQYYAPGQKGYDK
ncbi:hypothetical protein [Deinococcus aluminii]|uniref:Uncharacterized protein n=1 Tax=Deinococcus aluminii TaxID=1656885 RepID=A0ABP9XGH6_9DEIO